SVTGSNPVGCATTCVGEWRGCGGGVPEKCLTSAPTLTEMAYASSLYRAFQKRNFVFGQVEQLINDAIDLGFCLGNLSGQAGDLSAVAIDPVLPVGAIGQGDVSLEDLLHLGAKGGKVG